MRGKKQVFFNFQKKVASENKRFQSVLEGQTQTISLSLPSFLALALPPPPLARACHRLSKHYFFLSTHGGSRHEDENDGEKHEGLKMNNPLFFSSLSTASFPLLSRSSLPPLLVKAPRRDLRVDLLGRLRVRGQLLVDRRRPQLRDVGRECRGFLLESGEPRGRGGVELSGRGDDRAKLVLDGLDRGGGVEGGKLEARVRALEHREHGGVDAGGRGGEVGRLAARRGLGGELLGSLGQRGAQRGELPPALVRGD